MNRRDLLRLGASTAAIPAVSISATAGKTAVGANGIQGTWKPLLFDDHQNETVIALTELIIPATDTPGAKAAQVNRYIDLLLNDGGARQREEFLSGLNWLDGYALRLHSKPFVRCTATEQTTMLEALDRGAEDADLAPGGKFFRRAKRLTSQIYYSTEIGFKELNKGNRVPSTFACQHPEHG